MIKTITLADFDPDVLLVASDKKVLMEGVSGILASAHKKWKELAGQKFHQTRNAYLQGIQDIEVNPESTMGFIALVGDFPDMLENGASSFDMHNTLLGDNVPVAQPGTKGKRKLANGQGFYRAIPFRHQTPGTAGQGGGVPMGQAYSGHPMVQNAQKLGKGIYGLAKQLGSKQSNGQTYSKLEAGLAPLLKDHHSTDIYAGMVRKEAAYSEGVKQTGGYFTFRMISDNVPDKWLHPGIEAANLADEVTQHVEKLVPLMFGALFE